MGEGFAVKVITSPTGKDWNEALLAGITREAVQELLSKAALGNRSSRVLLPSGPAPGAALRL